MLPGTDPAPDSSASDLPPEEIPGPRPWGFWGTTALGLVVIAVFVGAQTAGFLLSWFGFPPEGVTMEEHSQDGDILGILTLVSGSAALGFIALFAWMRGIRPDRYLGFRRPRRLWHVLPWMLLTAGLGFLHSALAPLAGVESPPEFMVELWESTDSFLLLALAIAVMAPLFEETFFRGFLFAGWAPHSLVGTALFTSLFWTVIHLQYGLYELAFIFILGILFTVARHQTASLWTPLLMHALNNGLSLVFMALEMG